VSVCATDHMLTSVSAKSVNNFFIQFCVNGVLVQKSNEIFPNIGDPNYGIFFSS
jgi:hypothetical protein